MIAGLGLGVRARRGLCATGLLLALLALAPSSASATTEPIARSTCTGPGLSCDPCPNTATHCPQPTGRVAIGVPVSFDGRQSSDDREGPPNGTVVGWSWDFGDGATATGAEVSHAFAGAGSYEVRLTAADDGGRIDTHDITIAVVGLSIAATPSPGIVLGAGTLSNRALINGRVGPTEGATVEFRLYGPDDTLCTGTVLSETSVVYPAAGGPASATPYTPVQAGPHRWTVSYSGDGPNNPPIPARCSGSDQTVLVSSPPPPLPHLPPPPPPPPPVPTCFGKPATIVVSGAADSVTGTPGRDVIVGSDSPDTIDGRGGHDLICAGKGPDMVLGGSGDDKIRGGAGNDDLRGGSGKDRIGGEDGSDRVDGGAGNDQLDEQALGAKGHDRLLGGLDDDRIRTADRTTDSIDCGVGRDSLLGDARDRQTRCERVARRP